VGNEPKRDTQRTKGAAARAVINRRGRREREEKKDDLKESHAALHLRNNPRHYFESLLRAPRIYSGPGESNFDKATENHRAMCREKGPERREGD